jgi:hypothetical protein
VYFTDTRMHVWWREFFALLERAYPRGHRGLVFHPENRGDKHRSLRLDELKTLPDGAIYQNILYIPPAPAAANGQAPPVGRGASRRSVPA